MRLEGFGLDINVYSSDKLEDMECYPMHKQDSILAIQIRQNSRCTGKSRVEDMIYTGANTRHPAGITGNDLAALKQNHCRHREEGYVED